MGFIFLFFIISLQFTATFSVPGANFVKELHKFYMGSRFSFNPCGGIQHELLDDFYVEFFRQNLDNELELASKIAVYTLLYMIRWKANQNLLKLKSIYFLPNEQQMPAETKNLFVNICSALGEVHSAALWQRKAAEQTMSGVEFYTSLTCAVLRVKHELLRALSANPNQYAVVKPSCKDMEECFESVRNNSEEILEWVLSDLMHFFLKRKKLVKFFDEVKKRADKNEHQVIWFKFARLLGVPRMAMIYITHEENLDFLFSTFSRNSFYTHLYQSFFEDTTKLGKWRAKIVLDKFLYDEWFKEKIDNEFLFIAIWEDENDNADLNALQTNLVYALNDCWLAYSKSFWYDDKKIRAKIDDFAKRSKAGEAIKMIDLLLVNHQEIEQRKSEGKKTDLLLLWENGPEDVTLLKAFAICTEEAFAEIHKIQSIKTLAKYSKTFTDKFVVCLSRNFKTVKKDKLLKKLHFDRIYRIIEDKSEGADKFRNIFSKHEKSLKNFLDSGEIEKIKRLLITANEFLPANETFSISSQSSEEDGDFTDAKENFGLENEKNEENLNKINEILSETEISIVEQFEEENLIKMNKKEKYKTKQKAGVKNKKKEKSKKLKNLEELKKQKEIKYNYNHKLGGSPSTEEQSNGKYSAKSENERNNTMPMPMPKMADKKANQSTENVENSPKSSDAKNKNAKIIKQNAINGDVYLSLFSQMDYFEFKVKKISKFSDDNFLWSMYEQLIDLIKRENSEQISKIENPSIKSLLRVLDIGVYVNEIYHRTKAMNRLKELTENKLKLNLCNKFNGFDDILANTGTDLSKGADVNHLLKKLHLDLKRLIKSGAISAGESDKNLADEIRSVTNQMHLRKFTKFIIIEKAPAIHWGQLDKIRNEQILLTLIKFGNDSKENDANLWELFENYKNIYETFEAQRKLDANLLKQFQNDQFFIQFVHKENQKDFFLSKIEELPELMQEIKFKPNKPKIEMLIKSLEINGFLEDKEHIVKVVDELQRIIGGWSGEARLQAINANFIKYQNERVEPICLLPEGFDLQKIFGAFNCDLSKRTLCQDASLFCAFCNNLNTLSIQKDEKDQFLSVPILKIAFMGMQINIPFIIMPKLMHLPMGNYNAKQIERILNIFAKNIENLLKNDQFDEAQYKFELIKRNERMKELNQALLKATKNESIGISDEIEKLKINDKLLAESCEKASLDREKVTGMRAMVAVLSTYGSDMRILHLILSGKQSQNQIIGEAKNSKKLRTFLQALAYLEQWAINNHIYSTEMEGYLDSKILRVMLAKVFLSFPNASRPFLIEQFFFTFSTWNWPLPVQLQMIDYDRSGGFLIWSPGRQWMQRLNSTSKTLRKRLRKALTIPIISPMFPEQNLCQKINLLTAKVIQCKLREALTKLWNEKNTCAEIGLLKSTKFTDLYEEFVAISCAGPQFIIEKFCDFVGQRFGHDLVDFKEEFLGDLVEYLHLYPTILNVKLNNMPPSTLNTTKEEKPKHNSEQLWQTPHKKLWIFGIRLNKGLNESLRSKLNENLRTNFDVRIVSDFQAEFFFCKVQLHSKFVTQRELLNLVIL